jgi:hypothetical protein
MFRLFQRSKAVRPRPSAKLTLEPLEARMCPTITVTSFAAAVINSGTQVQLTGQVTGDTAPGDYVNFSGAVSGQTTTGTNGYFTFVGTASGLGTVNATAENQDLDDSEMVSTTVTEPAPAITNFAVTYGASKSVTLTGTVLAGQPGGLTVTFTGALSGSAVTNSDGTFSFTTTANTLGAVYARATDQWGVQTSQVSLTLASAPQITALSATLASGNSWTLSGTIVDASAAGITISFGGLTSLTGLTTTVASDGTFSFTAKLQSGEAGTATAQFTDSWGLASNQATVYVG